MFIFIIGNRRKGNEELEKFRTYYLGIENKNFRIGKEWSFIGLNEFVNGKFG